MNAPGILDGCLDLDLDAVQWPEPATRRYGERERRVVAEEQRRGSGAYRIEAVGLWQRVGGER